MTVCLSEPLFRVFIDSNMFLGFSSNTFKRRKPLAWSDFWRLSKICYLQTIPSDLKLRLFRTTCLSVLLYGCQTWIITKDMSVKLNAFATLCYRIMVNSNRLDKVSNERIYDLTSTSPLLSMVISRQLKFLGQRMNPLSGVWPRSPTSTEKTPRETA